MIVQMTFVELVVGFFGTLFFGYWIGGLDYWRQGFHDGELHALEYIRQQFAVTPKKED